MRKVGDCSLLRQAYGDRAGPGALLHLLGQKFLGSYGVTMTTNLLNMGLSASPRTSHRGTHLFSWDIMGTAGSSIWKFVKSQERHWISK